jgi:hypothetical protein
MRLSAAAVAVSAVLLGAFVEGGDWRGRARVDGRITDGDGAALGAGLVSARHLARRGGLRVRSDALGRFVLDGLAAGSWMVEIAKPGYRIRRIGVHLPSESSWLDLSDVELERTERHPGSSGPTEAAGPSASVGDVRAALAEGRVERARRLLTLVDGAAVGDADALLDIGRDLLRAGETELAVAAFSDALDRDPGDVDAHYDRALGLLALGRLEEARRDFEAVVSLQPESAVAEKAGRAIRELAPPSRPSAESNHPLQPDPAE